MEALEPDQLWVYKTFQNFSTKDNRDLKFAQKLSVSTKLQVWNVQGYSTVLYSLGVLYKTVLWFMLPWLDG